MQPNIVTITDPASGAEARVLVSLGFNCISWRPVLDDGPREMLWAHPEFAGGGQRPSGSGIPLLFPFPGRIGGATFEFGGRRFELEPGDQFGNAIHGFVHSRPWRIVELQAHRVVGVFQASVDDATILQRWPADFRIRVSYEVRGRELVSQVRFENPDRGPLPCGFATHTYFRLPLAEGGSVADTIVTVPAHKMWEAEQMLPTGRLLAVPDTLNLAAGLRLADHHFDTYFTDVRADAEGFIRTRLADSRSGRMVTQSVDPIFKQCIVYTPPHREAICVEPYSCIADAIRLSAEGFDTGLQILRPGEAIDTTLRMEVSG